MGIFRIEPSNGIHESQEMTTVFMKHQGVLCSFNGIAKRKRRPNGPTGVVLQNIGKPGTNNGQSAMETWPALLWCFVEALRQSIALLSKQWTFGAIFGCSLRGFDNDETRMMMMNDAPVNGLLLNGFIFFNEKMYKNHHKVAQKKAWCIQTSTYRWLNYSMNYDCLNEPLP